MKIRVSARVWSFLSGSGPWQEPTKPDGYDGWAAVAMAKIREAKRRKDGSVVVDLTPREREVLEQFAEVMAIGARENIPESCSFGAGGDALADYNAAKAFRTQLLKAGI